MKTTIVLLGSVFGLAACGESPSTAGPQVTSDAQRAMLTYQATGSDVASAIDQYRTDAAGMQDDTTCSSIEAGYAAKMGSALDELDGDSALMDRYMSASMGAVAADMQCVASAMRAELARHVSVACSSADVAANRSEAARHATTMAGWADHQRVRYEQLGEAVGMMPATTESTWNCTQEPDGSFMMGGQPWTPGSPVSTDTGSPTTPTDTTTVTAWPMPCGSGTCPCTGSTGGTPTDGTPTGAVALGQRIFESGIGVDGQPLTRSGGVGMMAGSCASCHGSDGHGRQTMMFTSPDITYANLTATAGMLEPDGTRGPVYTDELIRRAVTTGIDPDDEALSVAMPHWQLTDEDWNALLQYLQTL